MVNKHRGEVEAILGGKEYRLCLTLGALAELESTFQADDLGALVSRFEQGRFSASDLIKILGAGLRGAGENISNDELAEMASPEGIAGYLQAATALLLATFGNAEGDGSSENPR